MGLTSTRATSVNAMTASEVSTDGTPRRTVLDSTSTSRPVRVSRSPVSASSTISGGRASTSDTNCSRSSARTFSPNTAAAYLPEPDQHRLGDQAAADQRGRARHRVVAVRHGRDHVAEQPRDDQADGCGEALEGDKQGELGRVGADDPACVGGQLAAVGDGQGAHATAIPRSTRAR